MIVNVSNYRLTCYPSYQKGIYLFVSEPPECITTMKNLTDDTIESLVCPPPPSDREAINEDVISSLIVPAPGLSKPINRQSIHYPFNEFIPEFSQIPESPEFSQISESSQIYNEIPIPIFTKRCNL